MLAFLVLTSHFLFSFTAFNLMMKLFSISLVVCVTLFSCFKASNALPARSIESRNKTCDACNALVSFADRLSQANKVDGSLERQLTLICNDYSSLPGKQTTNMCAHIVRDVLKMFKNVNKSTFCLEISACVSKDFDVNSIIRDTVTDNTTCDFCIEVMTNVRDIITGSATELEVKGFVEDMCHYLGSFENECISLTDEYLDNLFEYIRSTLEPKTVCSSIGACTGVAKALNKPEPEKLADISDIVNIYPAQMPLIPLQSAEPRDLPSCIICKRLVKLIIQELKDNRTRESIIEALDHVCELFPKSDRSECLNFVDTYTEELINILTEETDPDLACTLIGVCVPGKVNTGLEREAAPHNEWREIEDSMPVNTNVNEVEVNVNKLDVSKSQLCYECEIITHFIQTELYDYKTEEQIEQFIENELCERLSIIIVKETCDSFVKQYGPQLMQLIAQKLFDPTTVCNQELRLCPNKSKTIMESETINKDVLLTHASAKCDLCVELVQKIDSLLENEQFDKELAQIVERACFSIPKDKQEECEAMVEAFAPYFLQMIGHLSNAQQICKSIDMCYTGGHVQLLGGHKCTFGPSYWCHTIAHADSCKATHYCRTKVWKAMP